MCTWNKEITCHVTYVVTYISYFKLSKQSRPSSGRSYKISLIWVNSVCKSVKMRLCEDKQGRPIIFFYISIPAKVIHCSLVHLKMCRYSSNKFVEKCFTYISSDLMFI